MDVNQNLFRYLALGSILFLSGCQADLTSELKHEESSILFTGCRGVVHGNPGEIAYKQNETLGSYETCVWQGRGGNATDYTIGIFSLGFSNQDNNVQLTVSCATFGTLQELVPITPGLYTLNNCTILIITLTTGDLIAGSHTGFWLQFSGYNLGKIRSAALVSTDALMDTAGYLRHPRTGFYESNDLSSFVFLPAPGQSTVSVIYIRNDMSESTSTFLMAYSLQRGATNGQAWEFNKKIFYSDETGFLKADNGVLVIFQTSSGGRKGFHFANLCSYTEQVPTSTVGITEYPPTTTDSWP